jgi:hypothetical protein
MTEVASSAASTCKRIGRNASAYNRQGGHDNSHSLHNFTHDSFLSD